MEGSMFPLPIYIQKLKEHERRMTARIIVSLNVEHLPATGVVASPAKGGQQFVISDESDEDDDIVELAAFPGTSTNAICFPGHKTDRLVIDLAGPVKRAPGRVTESEDMDIQECPSQIEPLDSATNFDIIENF